ncbi:MAG TPA: adenylate/guanylate cyclase domain-containing protein [Candidatus Binatia bacterium]|nr:adenylate/guanylate cyclase domain-containing protein [Candidatus Binatia bacterium]
MCNRNQTGLGVSWILVIAVVVALSSVGAVAQESPGAGRMMPEQGVGEMPMERLLEPTPFYRERTFLVLLGLGLGGVGIFVYRVIRSRMRRRPTPEVSISEAVLVLDLVGSTHLATHYGEGLALHAAEILQERTSAVANLRGLTFTKNTGDGCFMTLPSVLSACQTAIALLRDFIERPPDLSPAPSLELRAGISYGEVFMDGTGDRHGAAVNKAFRLQGLAAESFRQVEGENSKLNEIPERDRIFIDEEATQELRKQAPVSVPLKFLGFARLKGFSGLHRVYEVRWTETVKSESLLPRKESVEKRIK